MWDDEGRMYRAGDADPPATLDLHAMLKKHGDWMPLGSADEQKPAAEGTVEAWGGSRFGLAVFSRASL